MTSVPNNSDCYGVDIKRLLKKLRLIGVCIMPGESVTLCLGGILKSCHWKQQPHYAISSFSSYAKEMYSL